VPSALRAVRPAGGARSSRRPAELLTDGELVTLALNGAEPAFSHLLQRHTEHLRRLVSRRLRDPDDVRDVIQDTHLAVWRALQQYDAKRPFEAWLTSIALNKCRDWGRRRLARLALVLRIEADAAHDGAGIDERSAERLAMGEESVRDLERALGRLPAQLREPLVLTALLELPQAAAARELRATRKAVEMRVRRARQRLVQELRA
jgi:RNA polymerase sigma factor CnrH